MPIDGERVVKRNNLLKERRVNFDNNWERMAPFIAPSRTGITSRRSPGEKQTQGVYDSTSISAAETFAMFIAGRIINPSDRWLLYRMSRREDNRVDSIREWLDECRDISLNKIDNSSFYGEAPEGLLDYVGFGNGWVLGEERAQPENETLRGFRGFYFKSEKVGRYVIAEGSNGVVDTTMREFELSARIIKERFDRPGRLLPENVTHALNNQQPDKPFKVLHAIIPRPLSEQGAGALGMPWASAWVEMESKVVMSESGYRVFPVAIPRYRVSSDEIYGRGPGEIAFPDVWTLNTAKRMGFEDWALKIRPPVLHAHDSVFGTMKLVPGGATSVNAHGRDIRQVVAPFETGSRPEVSQIKEEELRRSIREIFFVDTIRQLLQVEKSEMTAFEFAQKLNLLFRMVATAYGRLKHEFLAMIGNFVFDTLFFGGAFPPPPPEIELTDGEITVEFENPIARAQRAGDAEALTLAFNDLAGFSQIRPEVFDRLDPDKVSSGIFDIRGLPAKWLRNDDELAALRGERAALLEKEATMEEAGATAAAAGAAAPMVKALTASRSA